MKFLHLSDLHIGRQLGGINLLEDQRIVLSQATQMARECDAVLLAGDLYNKAQPSAEAVRTVSDFLVSLSELGKPVFMISGNHDSPEQVAYCRELLSRSGVFVSPAFGGALAPHIVKDEYGELHIWLLPFIKPASVRPFFPDVRTYEDAVRCALGTADINPQVRNVLVAHQYVSGASVCDSENRFIGGVDQVGSALFSAFDYVALGHLHSPQKLMDGRIRYSGSPLKYSLSEERQRKAALMVSLKDKGALSVEERPFAPLHDLRTIRGELRNLSATENHSEDYVFAVLTDEGALVDPLGTLQLTYPNLIGMRLQNSRTNDEPSALDLPDAESQTPLAHFCAFYAMQNNGQPPDERRVNAMQKLIEEAEEKQHAAN